MPAKIWFKKFWSTWTTEVRFPNLTFLDPEADRWYEIRLVAETR